MVLAELRSISKIYGKGDTAVKVLSNVDIKIDSLN